MTANETYLQCRCGACRIDLLDPIPRFRCQCFCSDCRQRGLIFAGKRRENALPAPVLNYERGMDIYYFTNALAADDSTRELLEFAKLREDAANTTASARCCGTMMCASHPIYDGNTISVNADSCRITLPAPISNRLYLFGCDVPAEKYAALELEPGVPMIFSFSAEIETPAAREFLAAVTAPRPQRFTRARVMSFESLQTGKPLLIDNAYFAASRAG